MYVVKNHQSFAECHTMLIGAIIGTRYFKLLDNLLDVHTFLVPGSPNSSTVHHTIIWYQYNILP